MESREKPQIHRKEFYEYESAVKTLTKIRYSLYDFGCSKFANLMVYTIPILGASPDSTFVEIIRSKREAVRPYIEIFVINDDDMEILERDFLTEKYRTTWGFWQLFYKYFFLKRADYENEIRWENIRGQTLLGEEVEGELFVEGVKIEETREIFLSDETTIKVHIVSGLIIPYTENPDLLKTFLK